MMRALIALLAALICVSTTFSQPGSELPTPTERKEADRDGNGKIDSYEESYKPERIWSYVRLKGLMKKRKAYRSD
jgi:hypothetical protein